MYRVNTLRAEPLQAPTRTNGKHELSDTAVKKILVQEFAFSLTLFDRIWIVVTDKSSVGNPNTSDYRLDYNNLTNGLLQFYNTSQTY